MRAKSTTAKVIDGKVLYSSARLANLLGITNKTLIMWNNEGCPKHSSGWWDIEDVLKWRGLIAKGGYNTKEEADVKSLYTKKMQAEIKLKELKSDYQIMVNDIKNGELLRKEDVIAELGILFSGIKTVLRTLPRKCAGALTGLLDSGEIRRVEAMMLDTIDNQLISLKNGDMIAKKARAKSIK